MPKSKRNRRSNNASGYIGVTLRGGLKRYCARIYDSKLEALGTYDTAKQAANAYDTAAIELGRPLSKLNFPNKMFLEQRVTTRKEELEEEQEQKETAVIDKLAVVTKTTTKTNNTHDKTNPQTQTITKLENKPACCVFHAFSDGNCYNKNTSKNTTALTSINIARRPTNNTTPVSDLTVFDSNVDGEKKQKEPNYRGVIKKNDHSYIASFRKNILGQYSDSVLAAKAYDTAFAQIYGVQPAMMNFPLEWNLSTHKRIELRKDFLNDEPR